ncbi:MAG: tRNA-dihydrouridine synthase [Planctomycetota bacterium]
MSASAPQFPTPLRPLQLGGLSLAMPAVQAALSGYSDGAMRRAARHQGAPYALHEVVLDREVLVRGRAVRHLLAVEEDDHPIGGQLMGSEPETFALAARDLVAAGYDVIDLNFGCPVPKVLGRCRGGFLLSTPETALAVVDAVLDAVGDSRPVTVKMRRGLDDSLDSERAFFRILEGAFARGIAAATVHPRTVVQRYIGPSDWSFLARVRAAIGDRTLLGSGDLFDPWAVLRMIEATGVDGVTVARGAIGNPWIFRQVIDLLAGRTPSAPTIGEQREVIAAHVADSLRLHGPRRGFTRARTHLIRYAATHPDHVAVRDAFVAVRDGADIEVVLARHYPPERSSERSALLEANRLGAQHVRDDGGLIGCDAS